MQKTNSEDSFKTPYFIIIIFSFPYSTDTTVSFFLRHHWFNLKQSRPVVAMLDSNNSRIRLESWFQWVPSFMIERQGEHLKSPRGRPGNREQYRKLPGVKKFSARIHARPMPTDLLPPARTHLLNFQSLPKQPICWDQTLTGRGCRGHFTSIMSSLSLHLALPSKQVFCQDL